MTSQARPLGLAALAALGLAACSNGSSTGMTADGSICLPFPKVAQAAPTPANGGTAAAPAPIAASGDPAVAMEDCLHRWGYALAHASDDAQQTANAVVAACGPTLTRWNQAALTTGPAGAPPAPSLVTGQPTTPLNEHFIFSQSRALFYVVQARAGKCAAPPMKDGAPVGLIS